MSRAFAISIRPDLEEFFQHALGDRAGSQGTKTALFRQDGYDDAGMIKGGIGDKPGMIGTSKIFCRPGLAGYLDGESGKQGTGCPRTKSRVDLETGSVPTCSGAKIL